MRQSFATGLWSFDYRKPRGSLPITLFIANKNTFFVENSTSCTPAYTTARSQDITGSMRFSLIQDDIRGARIGRCRCTVNAPRIDKPSRSRRKFTRVLGIAVPRAHPEIRDRMRGLISMYPPARADGAETNPLTSESVRMKNRSSGNDTVDFC